MHSPADTNNKRSIPTLTKRKMHRYATDNIIGNIATLTNKKNQMLREANQATLTRCLA